MKSTKTKIKPPSNYSIRKGIRTQLHAARCADKDQSITRYKADAEYLNAELERLGITDQPRATWGS